MATTLLEPEYTGAPPASFITRVPGESEFTTAGAERPLFLKLAETAYHRHSPEPSRRSGKPNVFQGSLPIAVTPVAPQGESARPSLLLSGHGRTPGWFGSFAAYPISASFALASASTVCCSLLFCRAKSFVKPTASTPAIRLSKTRMRIRAMPRCRLAWYCCSRQVFRAIIAVTTATSRLALSRWSDGHRPERKAPRLWRVFDFRPAGALQSSRSLRVRARVRVTPSLRTTPPPCRWIGRIADPLLA